MDVEAYIRKEMKPLAPIPTGVKPKLPSFSDIKAVVFDIYGTLIVSAAGDIGLASEDLSLSAMQLAIDSIEGRGVSQEARVWKEGYRELLAEHQDLRRREGVEFPEVEIRDVWSDLGRRAGGIDLKEREIVEMAVIYECAFNPCWGMPGAEEVLSGLRGLDVALGVVSNAQFYTSAVVKTLLGISLQGALFEPDLCVFSFEEREGKPSLKLYEKVQRAAQERGISPESVFYLGNDCNKDIRPAAAVGFRTGLFAGDQRSLRLGGLGLAAACENADAVLTDLRQLGDVLSLKL